jgi:hypothetical protein
MVSLSKLCSGMRENEKDVVTDDEIKILLPGFNRSNIYSGIRQANSCDSLSVPGPVSRY